MTELEKEIKEVCRFCNPPDKERILYETNHFYVMISLGQIVEGYLLIISKSHIESCAQIPSIIFPEFIKVVNLVRTVLTTEYGKCLFYEHGRAASCLKLPDEFSSKHCYHAHLHCVPIKFNINEKIDSRLVSLPIDSLEHMPSLYDKMKLPYLFGDDGKMKMHFIEKEIRKQYLRYLVAKHVGRPELWDWLKYPEVETIKRTKEVLQKKFDAYESDR